MADAEKARADGLRSWTVRARVAWWAKFLAAVAAGVVSLAAASRVLGVTIDLQTKTDAHQQHEALRHDLEARQDKALERIEHALDRLGDRIDGLSARPRR